MYDLRSAGERFRDLGFHLKPGRPHDNSIENLHAKFRDGTEIELITASEPRDALSKEYRGLVSRGDGGAFVSLYSRDRDSLRRELFGSGLPLEDQGSLTFPEGHGARLIWFSAQNRTWPDTAQITSHPNGSTGIAEVWLVKTEAVCEVVRALGRSEGNPSRLDGGAIRLVDGAPSANGRGLVGVTVAVEDLARVAQLFRDRSVPHTHRDHALLLEPVTAGGIWLEFRPN